MVCFFFFSNEVYENICVVLKMRVITQICNESLWTLPFINSWNALKRWRKSFFFIFVCEIYGLLWRQRINCSELCLLMRNGRIETQDWVKLLLLWNVGQILSRLNGEFLIMHVFNRGKVRKGSLSARALS